ILPLIPVRGMCIFPHMVIHFDVGREKSIHALEEAMVGDQMIFLATQKDIDMESHGHEDIYKVGTIAKIKQLLKMPGNIIRVLVEGQERGIIQEYVQDDPFLKVNLEKYTYELQHGKETEALMDMTI